MEVSTYTIAIPVYERIMGFEEALTSALAVKGCTEVVICDDLSGHDTFQTIAESFKDDRIRYIKNPVNLGLFGNWNNCALLSTGDYISILCSDDLILPDAFENFLKARLFKPDIDVFFGSFSLFYSSPDEITTEKEFRYGPMSSMDFLKDFVNHGPAFSVLTITRRSILLAYPFVARPHSGNDWLWIYSNALNFNLFAYDKPVNLWRRHADQDANISQSITMDCWPMMYLNVQSQLSTHDSRLAHKAYSRAEGLILSWLLNDKNNSGYWHTRLLQANTENMFLDAIKRIIDANWLLKRILYAKKGWMIYYNLGRTLRKLKFYIL